MARIVGVHGVGHQFSGENSVRAEWLPALKDGLARVGRRFSSDDDFDCAFYGHLFRRQGKTAGDPPLDSLDVDENWELQLLELWWREAARIDSGVTGPGVSTKLSIPHFVQRALNALSQSRFFAGLADHVLISDLKQVRHYLEKSEVRRAACASIEQRVASDTTVIIAHSLGSVVAYEGLCAHPEWPVRTFVTIGSPLGISNLIFNKLQPSPEGGTGVWPQGIHRWFNIADKGDVVALVKKLGDRFGPHITDSLIDNGAKAHDATRYLTSKELGYAVSAG
jgi:hypothetical protein